MIRVRLVDIPGIGTPGFRPYFTGPWRLRNGRWERPAKVVRRDETFTPIVITGAHV